MAISEQWAELLSPGLRQIFTLQTEALAAQAVAPQLFNVMTSQKAAEYFLGAGGMSDWNEFDGRIEYDDINQLWKTTLTPKEFSKGFKVERKLVDDDLYNMITPRPKQLALAAMRTREKHAASVFNNAFSGSYVGGDAIALCGSHPFSPSNASTQSNAGSTALSYAAVVSTRILMRAYEDDKGELMPVQPDTILVPAGLEETAWSIVNTLNKVDVTDQHANFVRSKVDKVIVWDYLTDTNNWFLIDSALAKMHLLWIDRVALEFQDDPTSNYNLEAKYRGYMRYAYGWSDWRWVYGHAV